MDKPGYITPPPGLIPSGPAETSETLRVPERTPILPVFVPGGPRVTPPAAADAPTPVRGPAPSALPRREQQWTLTLHDDSVIYVSGTLLLGRDPARVEHWEGASLLRVNDPEKSVSKTHAAVDGSGDELRITDLFSTNGVVVIGADGTERPLEPGVAVSVPSGSWIELGRYRMRVERR